MDNITTEFEALVLREIAAAWKSYAHKFGWISRGITAPNFRIFDRVDRWGQWESASREMSFSRSLVTDRPWNEVLETLKHEMAHQYVGEMLDVKDGAPHGATFRAVCKQNGIDAAPRGVPGADQLSATNHIVEKVRHLLQLASNAGATEAEAKVAAETAHNMMLKYNIELEEKQEEKGYVVRYFGGVTGRIQAYMSELAYILSKHYFVEIIWINTYDPRSKKKGHELEVSGTVENLEVAEYVYEFLSRAAIKAWDEEFSKPEFKDKIKRALEVTRYQYDAPHSVRGYTISARSNFLEGFMQGFASQLKQAAVKEQEAGLVLARDFALEEFYKNRHPHIRHLTRGGGYNTGWKGTGFSAGQNLKIPPAAKAAGKTTPLLGK